jgi:hypothetical protein
VKSQSMVAEEVENGLTPRPLMKFSGGTDLHWSPPYRIFPN